MRRSVAFPTFCLILLSILLSACLAAADDASSDKKPDKKVSSAEKPNTAKSTSAEVNRKHERAALDFVDKHHSELSGLLSHLKSAEPKKYQQAIEELNRTSERLAGFEKRDPKRFEIELELWKTKSRIQVLAARMTMSKDPGLEEELLSLFKKQSELQLTQLEHEQRTVKDRLAKLEQQLAAKRAGIDQEPEKRLKQLLQTIRRDKQSAKKSTTKD